MAKNILFYILLMGLLLPSIGVYSGNKWWNPFEWFGNNQASNTRQTLSKPVSEWSDGEIRLEIQNLDESINRSKSRERIRRLRKKRLALAAELIKRYPGKKIVSLKPTPLRSRKIATWKSTNIAEQFRKFSTEWVYRFYKKRKLDYNYVSHNLERAVNHHKIKLLEKKIAYISDDITAAGKELQIREDLSEVVDPTHYPEFSKEWIEETIEIKQKELARAEKVSKSASFSWQRRRAMKEAERIKKTIDTLSDYLRK